MRNYIQYFVITYNEKESGKYLYILYMYIYVFVYQIILL